MEQLELFLAKHEVRITCFPHIKPYYSANAIVNGSEQSLPGIDTSDAVKHLLNIRGYYSSEDRPELKRVGQFWLYERGTLCQNLAESTVERQVRSPDEMLASRYLLTLASVSGAVVLTLQKERALPDEKSLFTGSKSRSPISFTGFTVREAARKVIEQYNLR